ncbi:MAG TPA: preprotein translocase subunit YajC [Gaiellaceae bacterium]|nr:preprotein translocase subunit YajC [Gaiellaceae bacterium]
MIVAASSGSGFFFIIIIAFLLLWLIVVRPQKKRQSQQRALLNELKVGDEILTAGGLYGTVSRIDDDRVTVEIAPKVEVRVARRAIAGITTEPDEASETGKHEDASDDDHEKWQSAFDEDDAGTSGDASNEKSRG